MSDPPTPDAAAVHRIEFDMAWPPWIAAAYLIEADEPVLVDAGGPGEEGWEQLVAGLDAAGYEPADVAHLLVTHPHTDHDGQVANIVDAAAPTVYALGAVRERLRMDPDALAARVRSNARAIGLPDDEVAAQVDRAVDSLERNADCMPPEAVDVALADGEAFEAGGLRFEPIRTPGHQRDHTCFAAGDALFAGDQVIETFRAAALNVGLDGGVSASGASGGSSDRSDGVFAAIDEYYAAYDRLRGRSFDRVYPGHGPVFDDYEGAVERSVDSLDELVAEVRAVAAEVGPASAATINDERVEDAQDYTLLETVGALGHLEDAGEVRRTVEDGVLFYEVA